METRAVAATAAMPVVVSGGTGGRGQSRARSATPSSARTRMTTPNQTGRRGRAGASPFLGSSSSSSSTRRLRSLSRSRDDDACSRAAGPASRAASRGRSARMQAFPGRAHSPPDKATPPNPRWPAEEASAIEETAARGSRAPAGNEKPLSERVRAASAASVRAALVKAQQRRKARAGTKPSESQTRKPECARNKNMGSVRREVERSRGAATGEVGVNPLYAPLAAWGDAPVTPRGSPVTSWMQGSPKLVRGPSWRNADADCMVQTNPMFADAAGGAHVPQKAHASPARPARDMSVPGLGARNPNMNSTRLPSAKPNAGQGPARAALSFAMEDIASRVALATGITALMGDAAWAKGAPSSTSADQPWDLLGHVPALMVVGAALGAGLVSRATEALAHILPHASLPAALAALLALSSGLLLLKSVSSALASSASKALQSSSSPSCASSLFDQEVGQREGAARGTLEPLAECVPTVELALEDSERGAVRSRSPRLCVEAGSSVLLAGGDSHCGVLGAASTPRRDGRASSTKTAHESSPQFSDRPQYDARTRTRTPIAGARGPVATRSVHLAPVASGFLETEIQSASFGVPPGEPLGFTSLATSAVPATRTEQSLADPAKRPDGRLPATAMNADSRPGQAESSASSRSHAREPPAFSSSEAPPSFGVAQGESLLVRADEDDGGHGSSEFFTPAASPAGTPRGSPRRQAYAALLQSVMAPCAPKSAPSFPTAVWRADVTDSDGTPPPATPRSLPLSHSQVRSLRSSPCTSSPCISGARRAVVEVADFGVVPGTSLFTDLDGPAPAAARAQRVASTPRGSPASTRSRVPAKSAPATRETPPGASSNANSLESATVPPPSMPGGEGDQMARASRQSILKSKSVQELTGMLVTAVAKSAAQQAVVVLEEARETIRDELRPGGVLDGVHVEARRAVHECVLHGEEHRSKLLGSVQGLSGELGDAAARAGAQTTTAVSKASSAASGLVRERVAAHNRATAAAARAMETARARLSRAWASNSKARNVVHVAPLPTVSLVAASVSSDHVLRARERPVEADVCVKRKLGVQACKAVLMEFISMHTSHCGFGLSKERQMQADVLVQQLEAKNEQLDMQQLQGQWKVLYSTSEGLISDSGKPFAQPAHLAFNQSALIFEFKPPESRGFLSINRGGRFVSDLVRLDDMSYELKKERYCVSRHYLGMGSASIVETSSRVKNIKVTYIDHSHAILRHENEAISVLALVNSDYVCC